MSPELHEQVEIVETKADFVAFVQALRTDFETNNEVWQHTDLSSYLDALAAWTDEAMDNYYRNHGQELPEKPNWKLFANILMGASVYE